MIAGDVYVTRALIVPTLTILLAGLDAPVLTTPTSRSVFESFTKFVAIAGGVLDVQPLVPVVASVVAESVSVPFMLRNVLYVPPLPPNPTSHVSG